MINQIEYRGAGKPIRVSQLGYGNWHLAEKQGPVEAMELMKKAYDLGIRLFDTSDNYIAGELLLGKAMDGGYLPKDGIVIATKTGLPRTAYEASKFEIDTSPERIREQVEKSRKVLGVESIGIYQLHAHDPRVPAEKIASTMNELIEQGQIDHYGLSNYGPGEIFDILKITEKQGLKHYPVSLQNFYNLLGWQSESSIEVGKAAKMLIFDSSPLYRGYLTEKNISIDLRKIKDSKEREVRRRFRELHEMAKESGRSIQQLSIAWLVEKGTVPLLGAYSQDHLEELVGALDFKLDSQMMGRIEEVRKGIHGCLHPGKK